jgi:hypothetical protein
MAVFGYAVEHRKRALQVLKRDFTLLQDVWEDDIKSILPPQTRF